MTNDEDEAIKKVLEEFGQIPVPPAEPSKEEFGKANAEALALASGENLQKAADENQHGRREVIRDGVAFWLKLSICISSILFIIGLIVFGWHIFAPLGLRWLTPEELESIQKTLSQIGLGAIFGF